MFMSSLLNGVAADTKSPARSNCMLSCSKSAAALRLPESASFISRLRSPCCLVKVFRRPRSEMEMRSCSSSRRSVLRFLAPLRRPRLALLETARRRRLAIADLVFAGHHSLLPALESVMRRRHATGGSQLIECETGFRMKGDVPG